MFHWLIMTFDQNSRREREQAAISIIKHNTANRRVSRAKEGGATRRMCISIFARFVLRSMPPRADAAELSYRPTRTPHPPLCTGAQSNWIRDRGWRRSLPVNWFASLLLPDFGTRGQVKRLKTNIDFGCVISTLLIKHLFLQQYLSTNIHWIANLTLTMYFCSWVSIYCQELYSSLFQSPSHLPQLPLQSSKKGRPRFAPCGQWRSRDWFNLQHRFCDGRVGLRRFRLRFRFSFELSNEPKYSDSL